MKSKKWLLIVLGLIAVGIGSLLWVIRGDMAPKQTAAVVAIEQAKPVTEDRVVTPQMFEPQYLKLVSGDEDFTPVQREKMHQLRLPEAVVRRALQAIAGTLHPVDFHLKIVDQNGEPVPGVKIEYSVNRSPGFGGPGTYFNQSDEQGRFLVTDTKAASIGLRKFTKPGYVIRIPKKESLVVAMNKKHLYTADVPLIVHAWKLGKPAKLFESNDLRLNKGVFVPNNGSWTSLYLTDSERLVAKEGKQPDADFWVSVVARVKSPGMKFQHPLSWSMILEAPNGGFQQTHDRFMLEAPESGYQSHLEVAYERPNLRWGGWKRKKFFLLLRGRKAYGRMSFSVYPYGGSEASVSIAFALNQEGTRNLYSGKPVNWY